MRKTQLGNIPPSLRTTAPRHFKRKTPVFASGYVEQRMIRLKLVLRNKGWCFDSIGGGPLVVEAGKDPKQKSPTNCARPSSGMQLLMKCPETFRRSPPAPKTALEKLHKSNSFGSRLARQVSGLGRARRALESHAGTMRADFGPNARRVAAIGIT
jgi:hypothetical protein